MRDNFQPQTKSLFDTLNNRGVTRERERERERVRIPLHFFKYIILFKNLLIFWREFSSDKKKRKDVAGFSLNLMDNLISLHNDLKNKTYVHGPYEAFKINDPKPRNIHKASVRDRLLHHAIYRILYPYFNKKFIHDSYSCRINKGTHRALNRFQQFARKVSKNNTKQCFILKCDIKKFFANINHSILKKILTKHIQDKDTLWLLEQVIDSFHTERKTIKGTPRENQKENQVLQSFTAVKDCNTFGSKIRKRGLPLGNLTSQLLVNIYMNEFDQFIKHELKIKYYIRYADDFVAPSSDKEYLQNLIPKISSFLENKLKLLLHPNKVFIKTIAAGVDFLGWVHFPSHRILRTTTKKRMMKKIKEDPKQETVQSYLGLLKHGNALWLQKEIEKITEKDVF